MTHTYIYMEKLSEFGN